jgi:hypothetical protein
MTALWPRRGPSPTSPSRCRWLSTSG